MRFTISQEDYCYFKNWLIDELKVISLPTTNEYELMKWKNDRKGEPMPICYRRDKTNMITLNGAAYKYYERYERVFMKRGRM